MSARKIKYRFHWVKFTFDEIVMTHNRKCNIWYGTKGRLPRWQLK